MDNKETQLATAHRVLASAFNLEATDVAIAYPLTKAEDAIRIVEGMKRIDQEQKFFHKGLLISCLTGNALGLASVFAAVSNASAPVLVSTVAAMGISALACAASIAGGFMTRSIRNDRGNEVKADIEYAKTPEWIHRLARENKL